MIQTSEKAVLMIPEVSEGRKDPRVHLTINRQFHPGRVMINVSADGEVGSVFASDDEAIEFFRAGLKLLGADAA